MRFYLVFIVFCWVSFNSFAQENVSLIDISSKLKVELDSLELRITENKWGIDTVLFFHFTLENNSDSLISITTNSCPSYNQFDFSFNNIEYHPNARVNCSMNAILTHELKPGESISLMELGIMNKSNLTSGLGKSTFTVYFIHQLKTGFQIFPLQDIRQVYFSEFSGEVKIIETKISFLKRKKKSKL